MTAIKPQLEEVEIQGVDALFADIVPVNSQNVSVILVSKIKLQVNQPRKYFDPVALSQLAHSIKSKGILQPLLVRPLSSNNYELIAGERRYQAAQIAGLTELPVIIKEINDAEAYELALMENLQREDLNPVEETEGILELLSRKMGKTRNEIIAIFQKLAHPDRQSVDTGIHKKEWGIITEVFNVLGKLTPESFRTNRLPLLNLPTYLLDALKEGKIEYSKVRVIGRLKDSSKAQQLLAEAIEKNLSRKEIEMRVRELKNHKQVISSLQKEFNQTITQVKKLKLWEQPRKKKKLESILKQLNELVES